MKSFIHAMSFRSAVEKDGHTFTFHIQCLIFEFSYHICLSQVPLVEKDKVMLFEVEVRGKTFYSKQVRKVLIRLYKPMTFVQSDKPIYLPGQTGNFKLITKHEFLLLTEVVTVAWSVRMWLGNWRVAAVLLVQDPVWALSVDWCQCISGILFTSPLNACVVRKNNKRL